MPSSAWNEFLARYRALHPQKTMKECMVEASASYRKSGTASSNAKARSAPAKKRSAKTAAYRGATRPSSSSFSSNPWIAHVQAYRASQGCSYAEAMQGARKTYRSAALQAVVAEHCKEPNAETEARIQELLKNEKAAEARRRNAEREREERKRREQEKITSLIPTIKASTDSNNIADLLVEFLELGGFERVPEIHLSNSVQVSHVVEYFRPNHIEAHKEVYMKFKKGEQTEVCKVASEAPDSPVQNPKNPILETLAKF